jgi:chemotaxis response regulator CheB
MPKAAIDLGAACEVLAVEQMPAAIMSQLNR